MNAVHSLWLLFTLVAGSAATCSKPVDCCPEVCPLDNVACLTPGGNKVYKIVVCELLDPLCIRSVDLTDGTKLTNIRVEGLCKCTVTKAVLDIATQKYQQHLSCPKLTITYELQIRDASCSTPVHVKVSVTINNYEIRNFGKYGIFISDGDHLPHFYVQDVCTTSRLVGDIAYSISATCGSCATTVNRPLVIVTKDVVTIIIKGMTLQIALINVYDKTHAMGVVFPASNGDL